MKHITIFLLSIFVCTFTHAAISIDPLINKITLRLSAEEWITTKTALVSVNVDAAVSDQAIEKLQATILQKLSQLASQGDWHIISFNRQQDKSGLESIQIIAQARLEQSNLGNLRDKAKNMSKPGETYTISSVQFTPNDTEINASDVSLRTQIYKQVKSEIDALNQTYSDQKFYVHSINFISTPIEPMAMYTAKAGAAMVQEPLAVGDKQKLQATVQIASIQTAILQSLVKP